MGGRCSAVMSRRLERAARRDFEPDVGHAPRYMGKHYLNIARRGTSLAEGEGGESFFGGGVFGVGRRCARGEGLSGGQGNLRSEVSREGCGFCFQRQGTTGDGGEGCGDRDDVGGRRGGLAEGYPARSARSFDNSRSGLYRDTNESPNIVAKAYSFGSSSCDATVQIRFSGISARSSSGSLS
jgi:hypothetical protein